MEPAPRVVLFSLKTNLQSFLAEALTKWGWNVRAAASIAEFELLRAEDEPDVWVISEEPDTRRFLQDRPMRPAVTLWLVDGTAEAAGDVTFAAAQEQERVFLPIPPGRLHELMKLHLRLRDLRQEVQTAEERLERARKSREMQRIYDRGEERVIDAVTRHEPLERILMEVTRAIAGLFEDGAASILMPDETSSRLRSAASVNLSKAYVDAIGEVPIAAQAGCCGTAAYLGRPVYCEDLGSDPAWTGYHDAVRAEGLCSCWSTPVFDGEGKLLATFAIYHRFRHMPTEEETRLIRQASRLVRIALEQEHRDQVLRGSEERYRLLFENSPLAMWVQDAEDKRFLDVNQAAVEQYGHPRGEWIGRDIGMLRALCDVCEEEADACDTFPGLERTNVWRHCDSAGRTLLVELSGHPLSYGGRAAELVIARDITAELEAERKLLETGAFLRSAGQMARLGAWSVDLLQKKVEWSDETARIHDQPAGFCPGFDEAISYYEPADQVRIREAFAACAEQGIPYDLECRLITAKGRRIWVRSIAGPVTDSRGRIIRVQGAFQDITPVKEAEATAEAGRRRFHQLAEAMPMVIWTARPDGRVDYANQRMYEYSGTPANEPIGDTWTEYLHPDDLARCLERWTHSVVTGEEFEIEYRLRSAAGEYRWHAVRATAIRDAERRITAWYGNCLDIHDTKELAKTARELVEKLHSTLESITDAFLSMDREWRFTFANSQARRLLPEDGSEWIGRTLWEVLPFAREEAFAGFCRTTLERNESGRMVFHEAAQDRSYELRGFPSAEGLALFFRDITESLRVEQCMKKQLEELTRWQALMLDRSDRSQALKREVNELLARLGEPPRYNSQVEAD